MQAHPYPRGRAAGPCTESDQQSPSPGWTHWSQVLLPSWTEDPSLPTRHGFAKMLRDNWWEVTTESHIHQATLFPLSHIFWKFYQTKLGSTCPPRSKANLLTRGCGEGTYSIYSQGPKQAAWVAQAQKTPNLYFILPWFYGSVFYSLLFFPHTMQRLEYPNQGLNPCSLQRK